MAQKIPRNLNNKSKWNKIKAKMMNGIGISWHPKLGHSFVLPLIIWMILKIRSLTSYLIRVAIKI